MPTSREQDERRREAESVRSDQPSSPIGLAARTASRVSEVAIVLSLTKEYTTKLRDLCLLERPSTSRLALAWATVLIAAASVASLSWLLLDSEGMTLIVFFVVTAATGLAAASASAAILIRRRAAFRLELDIAARILEKIVTRASELYENESLTTTERLELDIRLGEAEGTLALARASAPQGDERTRERYYDDFVRQRLDREQSARGDQARR